MRSHGRPTRSSTWCSARSRAPPDAGCRRSVTSPRLEIDLDRIGHNARIARRPSRGAGRRRHRHHQGELGDCPRSPVRCSRRRRVARRLADREPRTPSGRRHRRRRRVLVRSPTRQSGRPGGGRRRHELAHRSRRSSICSPPPPHAPDACTAVVLMVELGDLREGSCPATCPTPCARLPRVREHRAARHRHEPRLPNGVVPDDRNMAELSDLVGSVEAEFGIALGVVSGGNSVNLGWLHSIARHRTDQQPPPGRIDPARPRPAPTAEPIRGTAPGRGDAHRRGHRVEVQTPAGLGRARAQSTFAPPAGTAAVDDEHGWHSLLGLGHQDTDPTDLSAPPGLQIIGASSDHLVIASDHQLRLGAEVAFRPGYSALVRAVSSRNLRQVVLPL